MRAALRTLPAVTVFLLSGPPEPARADSSPLAVVPPGREQAERSLDRFAKAWMRSLQRAEAKNRRPPDARTWYMGYGEEYSTELRSTGRSEVPFVGLVRYEERLYLCADSSLRRCRVDWSAPVTEIFRFQGGRWIY